VDLSIRYLTNRRLPDKAIDLLEQACTMAKVPTLSTFSQSGDVSPMVARENVMLVISELLGIPFQEIQNGDAPDFLNFEKYLHQQIVGQPEAIRRIADAVIQAQAGLKGLNRPRGIFLFLGASGTGKTEMARAVSHALFHDERSWLRLDMSEFKEAHSLSRLVGAPPGYIGHDKAGQLTGFLWRTPYSLILLDELEKAHPEVLDLFLQVFSEGRLTDSKGRTVNAREAYFIMTSNACAHLFKHHPHNIGFINDSNGGPGPELREELLKFFRPEFINRIDEIIPFRPLDREAYQRMAEMNVRRLNELLTPRGIRLEIQNDVPAFIAGLVGEGGGHELNRAFERTISQPLAKMLASIGAHRGKVVTVILRDDQVIFGASDDGKD